MGFEIAEDGRVVLLRPRFIGGPLARWLQPHLRSPHFRVRLDALGSFVWTRCDGQTTVAQLAEALQRELPAQADDALRRLRLFLGELCRGKMLELVVRQGE